LIASWTLLVKSNSASQVKEKTFLDAYANVRFGFYIDFNSQLSQIKLEQKQKFEKKWLGQKCSVKTEQNIPMRSKN
jgi:hypothetical protein